jgi:hypothetical protein
VGAFNSISERRPSRPLPQNQEPSNTPLNLISASLLDAAIFGGYRMECLPRGPETEGERSKEAREVRAHLRTERENEVAAFLLSRSETETRSQTRRKAELFVGRQKRDLNDFDSYEVIAKRTDADGLTRYQVLWKGTAGDLEEEWDEEEEPQHHPPPFPLILLSPAKVKEEVVEVEVGARGRAGKGRRSTDPPVTLVDLTEDSS